VDALLKAAPETEGIPWVRLFVECRGPIGNSMIQESSPFSALHRSARIDILWYLSEHKKSTEISVLNSKITQNAIFVKYHCSLNQESA
jgi:hypothetical protein